MAVVFSGSILVNVDGFVSGVSMDGFKLGGFDEDSPNRGNSDVVGPLLILFSILPVVLVIEVKGDCS